MCSLSGGRRPARERTSSDPTPVNQPNNEGQQPSAEVGEGRAQTVENIVPSHMRPTQSGKRMSQGLRGVGKPCVSPPFIHGKSRMRKRARTDLRGGCVKKTRKRHAVRKMKVGPSKPPCRGRLQTAISCFGQKPRW